MCKMHNIKRVWPLPQKIEEVKHGATHSLYQHFDLENNIFERWFLNIKSNCSIKKLLITCSNQNRHKVTDEHTCSRFSFRLTKGDEKQVYNYICPNLIWDSNDDSKFQWYSDVLSDLQKEEKSWCICPNLIWIPMMTLSSYGWNFQEYFKIKLI